MASRRSRLQFKPNVGRPARGAAPKKDPLDTVDSPLPTTPDVPSQAPAAASAKDEPNNDTAKLHESKPVGSLASRRSRIKPQVSLRPVSRGTTNTEKKPDSPPLPADDQSAGATIETSVKDEQLREPPASSKEVVLPQSPVSYLDVATPNVSCIIAEPDTPQLLVKDDDIVKASPVRRRFPKARPNLAEAGRNRMRHPSISEADDDPRRTSTPILKSPPPVGSCYKDKFAATKDPTAEAGNLTKEQDTAEPRTKLLEKKPTFKKARRVVGKLTAPIDRSKMTIKELIYNNPVDNPTKSTLAEMEKKKRKKRPGDAGDSDVESVAGSVAESECNNPGSVSETPSRRNSLVGAADQTITPQKEEGKTPEKEEEEDGALPVPQVTIGEDGKIILNETSLVVQTSSPAREPIVEGTTIDETERAYNPEAYYGKRLKTKTWSLKETKRFYIALSMVGTDFSLMTKLFPNRNRTEIKRKFKKEEKIHKEIIDMALTDKRGYNLSLLDGPWSDSSDEEQENKKGLKRRRNQGKKEGSTPGSSKAKDAASGKKSGKRKKLYLNSSSDEEDVVPIGAEVSGSVGEGHTEPEEEVISSLHNNPTRSGRQPKRTQAFVDLTQPPSRRRKIDADQRNAETGQVIIEHLQNTAAAVAVDTRMSPMSPRPTMLLGPSASQGKFIPLSNLGGMASPTVASPKPNLVFVRSKPTEGDSGASDKQQLIHVYLVSPPGTPNPPPCASPPRTPQPLLSPALDRIVKSPPPSSSHGLGHGGISRPGISLLKPHINISTARAHAQPVIFSPQRPHISTEMRSPLPRSPEAYNSVTIQGATITQAVPQAPLDGVTTVNAMPDGTVEIIIGSPKADGETPGTKVIDVTLQHPIGGVDT